MTEPSVAFVQALPSRRFGYKPELGCVGPYTTMYFSNAKTIGDEYVHQSPFRYPHCCVVVEDRTPLIVIRVEISSFGTSALTLVEQDGTRRNYGSGANLDRTKFDQQVKEILVGRLANRHTTQTFDAKSTEGDVVSPHIAAFLNGAVAEWARIILTPFADGNEASNILGLIMERDLADEDYVRGMLSFQIANWACWRYAIYQSMSTEFGDLSKRLKEIIYTINADSGITASVRELCVDAEEFEEHAYSRPFSQDVIDLSDDRMDIAFFFRTLGAWRLQRDRPEVATPPQQFFTDLTSRTIIYCTGRDARAHEIMMIAPRFIGQATLAAKSIDLLADAIKGEQKQNIRSTIWSRLRNSFRI